MRPLSSAPQSKWWRNTSAAAPISAPDWRSFGRHERPWIKDDAIGLQFRAASFEKLFQLRRVIAAVVFSIQFEPETAIRRKVACGIAQEIIPFRWAPQFVALVIIEANQIGGDDVEFTIEFWQRLKRFDARNGARNLKQLDEFAKHRQIIEIEAENFVTE